MASLTTLTSRLIVAGGFVVAVAAAPVVVALSTPAAPTSPALAQCPPTEVLDPTSGACRPISDVTAPTQNPINPEGAALQPDGLTGASAGDVGELPAVAGVPCTGGNIGQCIGLQEATGGGNKDGVILPPVPVGVQP